MENEELIKLIDDGLHSYIVQETRNHQIFNEADLQACIYNYLKRIVQSDDCWPDWSVRCTPTLGGKIPDILLCYDKKPLVVMEIKCDLYPQTANIPYQKLAEDYEKLRYYLNHNSSLLRGYLLVVFDTDKDSKYTAKPDDTNDDIREIFVNVREFSEYLDWKDIWSGHLKLAPDKLQ
jgi:hypothetical protein